MTCPWRNPPPASSAHETRGQWSRPASLLIVGVRPNSPHTTTETSFSSPRSSQIGEQRREALIQQRQILPQRREVSAVMVPAAEGHRDAARARFHEPARGEKMLHELRPAVVAILRIALPIALHDARIFLRNIQRREQLAGSEHAEGLLIERIQPVHHAARIHIAAEMIEAGQQRAAVRQPIERDAIERHVLRCPALVRLERRVRDPEKARARPSAPTPCAPSSAPAPRTAAPRDRARLRSFESAEPIEGQPPGGCFLKRAARQALKRIMAGVALRHRADERAAIHHLRQPRQMLGNLDARRRSS